MTVNQDMVSNAFYILEGTQSMLCMDSNAHCAGWEHALDTPRDLCNGPRMSSQQSNSGWCSDFMCASSTFPNAINNATSGSSAGAWHRWGYVNDNNSWGTKTRVGVTADNDTSDSSDTIIGIGIDCFNQCSSNCCTSGCHGKGSGFYLYHSWANSPYDGALQGFLFIR